MRKKRLAAAGIIAICALRCQPEQPLHFEVGSIKLANLPPGQLSVQFGDRELDAHGNRFRDCCSLEEFITDAYDVKSYQISRLPPWAEQIVGDRYVIDAVAQGTPTGKQWRSMLQAFLAERFQLKLHTEKRDLPVYALVVNKGGAKVHRAGGGTPGSEDFSISTILQNLSFHLDRPLIDHTGLEGELTGPKIDWQAFGPVIRRGAVDAPGEAIFVAVQEQFGFKLEARKEPVDMMVIDHVEKPTAN